MRSMTFRVLAPLLLFAGQAFSADVSSEAETRFGFSGPEIFPIDNQIALLRSADIDGDGWEDLVIVNNSRSRINILLNQSGATNAPSETARQSSRRDLNELPPDARFRIESISSEKRISSLIVADLNSNGKPDLAYYGEPKELVVQYNLGSNTWSAPKRWPIEDGQLGPHGLAAGDLNGNGRTDLILLAETHAYLLTQNENDLFDEPERIPFSGVVKAVQVLDVDGDGRQDLLLTNWDSPNPFRFRLQTSEGRLGPEIHFAMPPIRSFWADDLDGDGKTEVITIAQNSGRAQLSNFVRKPSEPVSGSFHEGQFQVLPLNKTRKAQRGIAWADLDGDGLEDLLVSEPDSGQLTLYLQAASGEFSSAKTFPSLTGISDIAVADWNGDGKPEIFILSSDERQIGITQLEANGRIPFPRILPVEGRPLAMAVGRLKAEGPAVLAAIVEHQSKRVLWTRSADGTGHSQPLKESFKSSPAALQFHDVNQNGLADLVVLIPYERIKVLLQQPEGEGGFEEHDVVPPGGTAEQPWMSFADVDGDGKNELLLGQRNFVRAVVLTANSPESEEGGNSWSFQVKEQINGASSDSRILGAAPLFNGTNTVASLFLLDGHRKALTLCERDESGVWHVVRNVSLPVTEFQSLAAGGLGSAEPDTVVFLGLNAAGWMRLNGEVWELSALDGYETPIKDGHLADVVTGDLNNDGRKDLVFLEIARNYLDIVLFEPPGQLVSGNRWQVFEERTFRSRRGGFPEPREALIADVTGDGRNDLVVLVHDRILVYPQEETIELVEAN